MKNFNAKGYLRDNFFLIEEKWLSSCKISTFFFVLQSDGTALTHSSNTIMRLSKGMLMLTLIRPYS